MHHLFVVRKKKSSDSTTDTRSDQEEFDFLKKDLQRYLLSYNESSHSKIINGKYKKMTNFNVSQIYLLNTSYCINTDFLLYLKEKGADFNILSKSGLNFFHLYIVLLFYHPILSKNINYHVNFLIKELFKFGGFRSNIRILLSPQRIFSLLELLLLLQTKDDFEISPSFFPRKNKKSFFLKNKKKLEKDSFLKLYTYLKCYGEDDIIFTSKYRQTLVKMHDEDTELKMINQCSIFSIDEDRVPQSVKEILFIYACYKFSISPTCNCPTIMSKLLEKQQQQQEENHKTTTIIKNEIQEDDEVLTMEEYRADNYICNHFFLYPPDEGYFFRNTYLSFLLSNGKLNPYTRNHLKEANIKEWIEHSRNEKNFFFTTGTEQHSSCFPFLFPRTSSSLTSNCSLQKDINKNMIAFIEDFFSIHFPYHQVNSILNLERFEIDYIAYILSNETNLFPKFEKFCSRKNKQKETLDRTLSTFLKILLFYCKRQERNINVIQFFFEEILHDIDTVKKFKLYKYHNIVTHSYLIYEAYHYRFQTNQMCFFFKFQRNIQKIIDLRNIYEIK